jgi:mannose-6-phosphate isomerase
MAAGASVASPFIGPVVLRPIYSERVWGVETLPDWYEQPKPGKPVGEAWLSAVDCVAETGLEAGKTLGELSREHPVKFGADERGEFPLLVKTLFPREKLSVQVHPNDAQAQAVGEPRGKTECWYVLEAEPGATVALGFQGPIMRDQVRRAIEDHTLEEKLRYVPVKAGDLVYVSAGTIHAIGPGVVMLETQQYSDSTYRLYDYGRPRELHVEAGLNALNFESDAGLKQPVEMDGFTRLIRSNYFVVDRFTLRAEGAGLGLVGQMQMLFAMVEGCSVLANGVEMPLEAGHVVVLPGEDAVYSVSGPVGSKVIRIAQP